MRLGLVMTVRDERPLLRTNLLFHRHLGVERVYLYDDGSSDGTPETVRDLEFVSTRTSVSSDRFRDRETDSTFLRTDTWATVRQRLNAWAALEEARDDRLDWLLHLDADELVCPDLRHAPAGQLREFFAGIPAAVAQVRFPTLEAVQRRTVYRDVFAEETLFKLPQGRIRRRVRDPLRGRELRVDGFYGHRAGKSAVRTAVPARPRSPHVFMAPDGGKLESQWAGSHLHYYACGAAAFAAKLRRLRGHPDTWASGAPLEPHQRLWRDLANAAGLAAAELARYYDDCVRFSEPDVERLLAPRRFGFLPAPPAVVEVTAVREALSSLRG
jgi:hypothetical protein